MAVLAEINGEAIFGTRPWEVYGEGPTAVMQENSEEIKESFTSEDIRFATRGDTLYTLCPDWPKNDGTMMIGSLLDEAPSAYAFTLKIAFDGHNRL